MQIKRRFTRWQINAPARIKTSESETFNVCNISDIGLKGARLSLKEKLAKDVLLGLTICLSEDCSLRAEAWVVWHKCVEGCNHYGLYFKQINDYSKNEIYRFVRGSPENIIRQLHIKEEEGALKMEDRRIFERFATRLPLRFLNINSGKECIAETRDISVKGIGTVCPEEFAAGTPLELWVDVPGGGGPLYSRGQVAWSRPDGSGQYMTGINLDHADLMGVARVLRAVKNQLT